MLQYNNLPKISNSEEVFIPPGPVLSQSRMIPIGFSGKSDPDTESSLLIGSATNKIPEDKFHLAYISHFTLRLGVLLPSKTFITAVDYFSYLYPEASVDRVIAVAYTLVALVCLFIVFLYGHNSCAYVRINVGMSLFVVSLLVVPIMDAVCIKGQVGLYGGFYVTTGAMGFSGLADALVQGGSVGAAGELPERYMQAAVAGTAASGFLLPTAIIKLKSRLSLMSKKKKGAFSGSVWRSTLWDIVGRIKWYGFGIFLIYILSIFPGYITEDVHSQILKDWYPIILITGYNVFDFVGKSLTAVYLPKNAKAA